MANKIKLVQNGCCRVNILTTANNKGRYINKIYFYDDNGVIFENGGIIETLIEKETPNGKKYTIEHDFYDFELEEPIKKNKVDLTIKKNFFVGSFDYMDKPSYDLYIYCNNGENTPKITKLEDNIKEFMKGENHIYNNYLVENVGGYILETAKATPETATANTFTMWGELYTRTKAQKNKFIINKFNRIERTEQAEKIRELEHILYTNYNLGIKKATEIKNLLNKYKKYLGE